MAEAVDFKTCQLTNGKINVGSRGITMLSAYGIGHINATSEELKQLGEFLLAYVDDLEFDHPQGQS